MYPGQNKFKRFIENSKKEIHIPLISVNQESGEYLGCPNNISTIQDGNNQIIVRLCWFGDGQ